jgi:hypothetical protein
MHALNEHVAGEQQIVGRAARAVNRAVVADRQYYGRSRRYFHGLSEALGDCPFVAQVEV